MRQPSKKVIRMDPSVTAKLTRPEQCKKNAQEKSEKKRRAAYEAIALLQKEGRPVTKAAVAKRAGVSVVFLRNHLDLVQSIEEAERMWMKSPPMAPSGNKANNQVLAALQRRMEKMKEELKAKDATIRQKDREITVLYGKLASGSVLTDAELRQKFQETLQRLEMLERQMEEYV